MKLRIVAACLAGALASGCGGQSETADAPAVPVAPPEVESPSGDAPGESTEDEFVASFDGVRIHYDVQGSGDTALVFVHCWSCDHEYWREQLTEFDDDYRVVSLDLGGHGLSDAGRETWAIKDLARDVVAVADHLKLNSMILIGHSMGGPVSLEAARLMRGRVLGVVAADTLHDADFEFPQDMSDQVIAAFENDFAGAMAGMFSGMSGLSMNEDLKSWIVSKATRARPKVATDLMRNFASLDMPEMFRDAGVPIRAINAAPNEMTPPTQIESNRKYADFDAVTMDGVGHFLQLESPADFNAHLRRFIEELEAAAPDLSLRER